MQSLIQIIKVSEPAERTSRVTGNKFTVQEAECILLNDDGTPSQVGVLRVPRDLIGKVTCGTFLGSFALNASYKDRSIEAVLTGLSPYAVKSANAPKAA